MKTIPNVLTAIVLCLSLAAPAEAAPAASDLGRSGPSADRSALRASDLSAEEWNAFGRRLVAALRTSHQGLQTGAMRLAIQHAGRVDVSPARIDLIRVYREAEDESVRRMAVVTLGTLGDAFTIGYLRRAAPFEKSPAVRRTMNAVVANHYAVR